MASQGIWAFQFPDGHKHLRNITLFRVKKTEIQTIRIPLI
jgi:hypothetical protein